MTKTVVFNTLGMEDAIDQSFMEVSEQDEAEAEEQICEQVRGILENWGKKRTGSKEQAMKQVSEQDREQAMKQAMLNWDE